MLQEKSFSFIEESEVEKAKETVREHLAKLTDIPDIKLPVPVAYHMAVAIYTRPEDVHILKDEQGSPILDEHGKPKFIEIPKSVTVNDKWRSCVALVVAQGPECYTGERFSKGGPWCKVGDFIVIPRNEGVQINYRGIPMQLIPDDRVLMVIEDPTHVTRD